MNQNLSEIQQVLLTTYTAFKKFCDDNGIKFFAAFGTMIGAVRHQGFIPWDDDIDVFMLCPDYNKFISLKSELAKSTKYKIADYHDKGYPYGFAKFYDTTKTFWEYKQFPFVIGPFIDVFPLYEWDANDPEMDKFYDYQHSLYWKLRKSVSYHTWREIFNDFIHLNGLEGPIKLVKKVYYAPQQNRYLRKIEKVEKQKECYTGPHYIYYTFSKSKYYDKHLFDNALEVPFEDTTIYIPEGYEGCLRVNYRDYTQLPPVEDRKCAHPAYYLNLERHLTIDEILAEKTDELLEHKPMKLSVIWDEFKHRNKSF